MTEYRELSPAAVAFAERERKKLKSQLGCMMTASGVATALLIVGVLLGWTKVAALFILGPIGLVLFPLFHLWQKARLEAAVAQRKPGPVVEMYLRDLDESLREEHPPEFARSLLTTAARDAVGPVEALRTGWRQAIEALAAEARRDLWSESECAACGEPVEGVVVEASMGLSCAFKGPQLAGIRCLECERRYCRRCAQGFLEAEEESAFKTRYRSCACGREPYPAGLEWIVAPGALRLAFEFARRAGDTTFEARALLRWIHTGIYKEATGTGTPLKNQDLALTKVVGNYELAEIDGRWQVESALPPLEPHGEVPSHKRWIDSEDDPF